MASTKMSLKLLVDTKANKVIFAEAGKDFVDFLFSLLSIPVGAVIKLLKIKSSSSVGCLGNVYQSFGNLDESYMQPNLSKAILLNPKIPEISASVMNIPLLLAESVSTTTKSFYSCSYCNLYLTDSYNFVCPRCRRGITRALTFVGNNGAVSTNDMTTAKGYVQGLGIYMVSDDLSVTPMSMITGIQLMNKLNISQFSMLEERVVQVGMDEGLELLRASFQSEAALTAVFLRQKIFNDKRESCGADTKMK